MTGSAVARGPGFCGGGAGRAGGARSGTRWSPGLPRPGAGRWPAGADRSSCCPAGPDPAGLLPVVCYLCQGLIAPQFVRGGSRPGRAAGRPRGCHCYRCRPGEGEGRCACAGDRRSGPAAGQMLTVTAAGQAAWRSRSWWARCAGSPGPGGRVRRVASWLCWPAAVSPCRTGDRCAFIRLGDTVARFTVMPNWVLCVHARLCAAWHIHS
jgi:hypothetical protein